MKKIENPPRIYSKRIPALAPDKPKPELKRPPAVYSNPNWLAEYEKKYKNV